MQPDPTPPTVAPPPSDEPTEAERRSARLERVLDIPMAVLALVWALLVAYDLVAPAAQRPVLTLAGNTIWAIFGVELVAKLVVSRHPARFLRRHWPSVLFLVLPALRMLRVLRAVRALRVLPAARVVGSSYRAVGTARSLLQDRLVLMLVSTAFVVLGSAQLLLLVERGREGGLDSLGDALWAAANLAVSTSMVYDPVTLAGRVLTVALSAYGVVVFASVAAALGAFFVESRAERAATEDEAPARPREEGGP